jgi:hypothetical protein
MKCPICYKEYENIFYHLLYNHRLEDINSEVYNTNYMAVTSHEMLTAILEIFERKERE